MMQELQNFKKEHTKVVGDATTLTLNIVSNKKYKWANNDAQKDPLAQALLAFQKCGQFGGDLLTLDTKTFKSNYTDHQIQVK